MKAYSLYGINDLRMEEVESPKCGAKEVLVEVKAAGICGSDIPRIFETGTYSYPLIPGHEFSGIVAETGAEVDAAWQGKRVGIFPLLPCENCVPCNNGRYEMCRAYSYLGSRKDGGFAQYVVVPEWNLIELPEGVSYEVAAMLEPMAVAVHAMRSIQPEKKDTVLVYGLGTIGLLLTMFLKEAGIDNLLVIGNKAFQKKNALELGISEEQYFDGREKEFISRIMEYTGGLGANVVFECIGKNEIVSQAIQMAAPGGRIQLVGNPASDMQFGKNTYWKILRNQLTIKGVWNSSFLHSEQDDWHYVLRRLSQETIHPECYITQKFPLEQLGEGLRIMKDKTQEYVKVMITSQ